LAHKISVTTDPLAESLAYLTDAAHKAQLFDRTGACVVDMESAAIARIAQESNLPFLAVRAVLDTADLCLPIGAVNALGPDGHLRVGRLVTALVEHPSEIASLLKLARGLRRAQASLAEAAKIAGPNLSFAAKGTSNN
jgi:adenosylhomocysteine nucleosidase